MKVIQVKCPNCGQPIHSKVKDLVYLCENCNTLHSRNGGIKVLDFEVADANRSNPAEKIYMPFWRVWCNFTIHRSDVEGGGLHKLGRFFRGDGNSGSLFIFVPAWELDIYTFKQIAMDLTLNTPRFNSRVDFGGIPRQPVAIERAEAEAMADFVFVTMEADKPGVMQALEYTLQVQDARLVYMPFTRTGGPIAPAW